MSSWFDSLKSITDQVQQTILDPETLQKSAETFQKLTLTSPELTAERQRIDAEERHKEEIRNTLAGMLPWETKDTDREILVEECKEAVLQLSAHKETFFGPFGMPDVTVHLKDKESKDDAEEEEEDQPSNLSLEKLQKLEPLPALLQHFDLDAHVGLIERVLKEDPNLVGMQSKHSGT